MSRIFLFFCLLAVTLAGPCAASANSELTLFFTANTYGFFKPCPS